MALPPASPILSEAMLQRLRERVPGYDRENRFFQADFDELRRAGYLTIAVPRELGGGGLSYADRMLGAAPAAATSCAPSAWTRGFPSIPGAP